MVDLDRTKLQWVPAIANPAAPTVTELNVGTDVGVHMAKSYDVGTDRAETVNEPTVYETANIETPTIKNYHGTLEFQRSMDDTTGIPEEDDLTNIIEEGDIGFFVRRTGLPHTTAFAAAQEVEVYKFLAGSYNLPSGTGAGMLKGTLPLHPQGVAVTRAVVAGGA
jgi:hypothetical protein